MNFADSYFNALPNEILVKILKNINTYDLLQFCEAYSAEEFLNVNELIRNIKLSKCYKLRNLEPIKKLNLCYIKTVNINGLYWLRENHLRSFLYHLENLENLFALDTVLGLMEKDLLMYRQLKLKKLAINVKRRYNCTTVEVPTVETLLVKLFKCIQLPFYQMFPRVKVLWFEEPSTALNYPLQKHPVQKLMHKVVGSFMYKYIDLINLPEKLENVWPEEWQIVNELPPYPFRTLYTLKAKNIDDIMLDELNFTRRGKCSTEYFEAIRKILSSPNTKYLKKLAIKICYLHYIVCCIKEEEQDVSCCLLERYSLQNWKNLEVLEIYDCFCTRLPSDIFNKFPIIPQLKHLKYLLFRLYKHKIDNGQFLIDISNNCQQLETLKIISSSENNKMFNLALCTALKNAKNLKNFQYQTNYFTSILEIFTAFCSIENPKLERLTLFCGKNKCWGSSELQILEKFLLKNPQLLVLCFDSSKQPWNSTEPILMHYEAAHPAKCFIASRFSDGSIKQSLQDVHYTDMIMSPSIVSKPDIYQEVEIF